MRKWRLVKWKREDGMLVLLDRRKPIELWLSIRGSIYDLHFQVGRLVICIETSEENRWLRKARAQAAKAEREAARARHPAGPGS